MKRHTFILLMVIMSACAKKSDANLENFTKGMVDYLDKRGDLCLGKSAWPIDVTERAFAAHSRDAVQMPVLEKLGLVTSSDAVVDRKTDEGAETLRVKRYQLTEAGKRNYLVRDATVAGPDGARRQEGDFCAARLRLDRVVAWEKAKIAGERPEVVVSYTYKVDAPAWARDPEIVKVFPAVGRVVRGAGAAELTETFTLTKDGWVANDLLQNAP